MEKVKNKLPFEIPGQGIVLGLETILGRILVKPIFIFFFLFLQVLYSVASGLEGAIDGL